VFEKPNRSSFTFTYTITFTFTSSPVTFPFPLTPDLPLYLPRSEVGPWEPTTDLGQLIISDVRPAVFVPHMRALVQTYWDRLVSKGTCPP
jgi:hypothetical protein